MPEICAEETNPQFFTSATEFRDYFAIIQYFKSIIVTHIKGPKISEGDNYFVKIRSGNFRLIYEN